MRVLLPIVIACAITCVGRANAADGVHDPRAGMEIGVRVGAGLGFGSIAYDARSDTESKLDGALLAPVQIDVGYRVTRFIYAGTFFQHATGGGTETSAAGGHVRWHFTPARFVDPWAGMGIGYEWYRDERTALRGLQWGQLGAGADIRLATAFVAGPFITAAFGQYTSYSTGEESGRVRDIGREVGHTFLTFGVRGAFTL